MCCKGGKYQAFGVSAKSVNQTLEEVQQNLLEGLVLEVGFGGYAEICHRVKSKGCIWSYIPGMLKAVETSEKDLLCLNYILRPIKSI